jgi:oligopeptide/dipeptide ABC transporter ATP-binding protein
MMLAVRSLTLRAARRVFPVWNVDLSLEKGERLSIIGESGGGKTSLAWALTGRPLPGQEILSGEVSFCGMDLLGLSHSERAKLYYRRMALVPQNAQDAFHPARPLWKSAREVASNGSKCDRQTVWDLLSPLSRAFDLSLPLWSHYPHQLSGGQKQRMALILALLNRPELLILDEPTNALDELTRSKVLSFLDHWIKENRASVVLLTHDIGMGALWGGRTAVLYRGEIIEELPAQRMEKPLHPYTRGLMDAIVCLGDPPLSRHAIAGHTLPLSASPQGCTFIERCSHALERCRQESPRLNGRGEFKVRCFIE